MDEKMGLSHQIMLYNREKGNLTGILDVISFDEKPSCWIQTWGF